MAESPELWRATYQAATSEELNSAYAAWAGRYDQDTLDHMGYVGPRISCELLDNYLDSKESRILDAGCGTGLVGEVLTDIGYRKVDAFDYCGEMLDVAKRKDVYEDVFQADLNRLADVEENTYDASVCVGTFTYAHVGPKGFDELIRITKPGGYVCFTVRDGAYQEYDYRRHMLRLEADNSWELLTMAHEPYLVKEDVTAKFCVYKVTEAHA